jgi:hypothetical protein
MSQTKRNPTAAGDRVSWQNCHAAKLTSPRFNPAEKLNQAELGDDRRSVKRQRQVAHIYEAGPRPVLEALFAVESGQPLDEVLADFCRIAVSTYHMIGANELPISRRPQ